MLETLLIATDGSTASEAAEHYAVALAAALHAQLVALSIVDERLLRDLRSVPSGMSPGPVESVEAFLELRTEAALKRVDEACRTRSIEYAFERMRGMPDARITQRSQSVDLLIIGRGDERASGAPGMIGSTCSNVLRQTMRSTLVVPQAAVYGGPVLLAYDGSEGARRAAGVARELVHHSGEPLHIFVDSKDKYRAERRFEEAESLLGPLRVPLHRTASSLGRPDMKIVDTAREKKVSMILMGAYGRNRIREYFLGSNAFAVVRSSPIAVFLARGVPGEN